MAKLNPVTLEVVRNAMPAIANEMAADLHRTSYNMMIYEVRDFCTALVLPDGALVSQNVGGVSHFVADLGVIIEDGMAQIGRDGFHPDDVIITNHQRVAGQHLNNVVIYTPYFFKGELIMFSMVRAHWIDIGGMSTGFGGGSAVPDPWLEGLQLDQLKVYEAGKPNETLLKIIRDNIRFPDSSLGDMRSQIAACKLAVRRLDELFNKFGRDTMLESLRQIFDETEQRCRNIVTTIPDGVYEAHCTYDVPQPGGGLHLPIHAKVTVDHGHMTIDLSGCAPEQKLSINARSLAGAYVAYKNLTAPLEPVNQGSFAALDVIIPEGNIMMARYPAGMANWSGMIPTVVDTIVTALSKAIPERIPAAHHGLLGGSVVFFGVNPKTGKRFVVQSLEGGGWGGRPHEDGESGSVSICQGDVRNGTLEGIELKTPVLVEGRILRTDSGGAGKFRGGLGIDLVVRNLVEGRWNLGGKSRETSPPWGIHGGKNGDSAVYLLRSPGEDNFAPQHAYR
ncbi:MAG TPA: hydantoinase B/oxoprolinase family protein, partial [Stellaceae bacterium]|nr:hydantoinase B/oxoprolinase family protein [Stellaceae bacterium]